MAAGLTRTAFEAYFNDASTGKFKDGQAAGAITEAIDRDRNTVIKESSVFFEDFTPLITATSTTAYTVTAGAYGSSKYTRPFLIKMHATNTGACTLNPDGAGAKDIKKRGTASLVAGDLQIDRVYLVAYDGTNFQLVNYDDTRTAVVNVSSAEILALNTTPKEIIAAPGANLFIELIDAVVYYAYGGTPYATATGLTLQVGTSGAGTDINTNILDQTVDELVRFLPTGYINPLSGISNTSLVLKPDIASNPTAGNGALKVYVTYRVFAI